MSTVRAAVPEPREPSRRLFFALWPDEAQRGALADAAAESVRHSGGRPVPVSSVHVTLAFLGSVPERRVGELHSIAHGIARAWPAEARPMHLTFDRLVHWAKPQILCVLGSETPDAQPGHVARLAAALKDETAAAGFSPDLKPFRAHVTVARKVTHASALHPLPEVPWSFDAFALIASDTRSAGPVYSVVESYSLVKDGKAHGES